MEPKSRFANEFLFSVRLYLNQIERLENAQDLGNHSLSEGRYFPVNRQSPY